MPIGSIHDTHKTAIPEKRGRRMDRKTNDRTLVGCFVLWYSLKA